MSSIAPLQTLAAKPQPLSSSAHAGLLLQRKCACGSPTSSLAGECAECKSKKRLQTKLTIGESNDPLEQEADRVADQVMAAPTHSAVSAAPPRIQRYLGQASAGAAAAPASVDRVLASPGRPLEPALRQDMEHRFGHDFSRVRVQSGAAAEQSARDVNAQAFTVGHNIVFGAGRFAPGTHQGRRLIAHELTHVMQQSGSDGIRVGHADEKHGLSPFVSGRAAAHSVQRQPNPQAEIEMPAGKTGPWGDPIPEYPIVEGGKTVMVDQERYVAAGARLLAKYYALAKAIPADAVAVLKTYKLAKIKDLYTEPLEDLQSAANSLNTGNLVWAHRHLKNAGKYVDIEAKAEKMFFDIGVVGYVGKQLDMAVIGFFEGSANALLGMVDTAGGLFGYDPGLVAWNTKQYSKIKHGYAQAAGGIDPEATNADEIGRAGGQVAAGIATMKWLGGAGVSGQAAIVFVGVGGMLKVAENFKHQHDVGEKSWGEIFSDPVNLAVAVGAIAGAAGMGALALPSLRTFLNNVGLVVSSGQLGVTAGALIRLSMDKTLSADEVRDKTLELLSDALTNFALTGEGLRAEKAAQIEKGSAPNIPKSATKGRAVGSQAKTGYSRTPPTSEGIAPAAGSTRPRGRIDRGKGARPRYANDPVKPKVQGTKKMGADPKTAVQRATQERIRQIGKWEEQGKIVGGDTNELRDGLRKGSPEAEAEYLRIEGEIKRGNHVEVEPFTDTLAGGGDFELISTAGKQPLRNSPELRALIPDQNLRNEFMAWLKENHAKGDLGDQSPLAAPGKASKPVKESHEHLALKPAELQPWVRRWWEELHGTWPPPWIKPK